MGKKYLKSIDKIVFDKWYQSGLKASVDWVAGGNFEGEISRSYLRFLPNTNKVEIKSVRICERGSEKRDEVISQGEFRDGGKGAIHITFEKRSMRGFVLGKNNQYIAFDCYFPNVKYGTTEAYELVIDF